MSIQDLTATGGPASAEVEPAVPLEEALRPAEEKRAVRKAAREQAAGLRALADVLETNPDLAERLRYSLAGLEAICHSAPAMAELARLGMAAGAKVTKEITQGGKYFEVHLHFGPVVVKGWAERQEVCERVVVGTETVTKKVKDPTALAAVPEIEVTEEVEQVEWRCRPLLAESTGDGA